MSALEALQTVHHLTVIEGGKSKRGRPTKEDDARLDLAAHRSEERARAERMTPLRRQMMLVARKSGPAVFRVLAAIDYELSRHATAWQEPQGPEAA